MKKWLLTTVSIFLISLFVVGCVPQYDNNTTQTASQTQSQSTTLSPPPYAEDYILASKNDLSQRLNISIDEINIVFIKAVIWSDTSLGCPQEDMEYAQVLTEGYQILLETLGNIYEYHTDSNENIVLCASAPSGEVTLPDEGAVTEGGESIQPKDPIVIITTPTKSDEDASVQDGGPNQPKDTEVVITTPVK
jgi:hypothetical protein